jgi:hypothetical protein
MPVSIGAREVETTGQIDGAICSESLLAVQTKSRRYGVRSDLGGNRAFRLQCRRIFG